MEREKDRNEFTGIGRTAVNSLVSTEYRNEHRVCACARMHVGACVSQLRPMGGPRRNNTPVAISIPSIQILISQYHTP